MPLPVLSQKRFNGLLEYFKGLGADHRLAIDKKGRCTLHTQRLGGLGIFLDQGCIFSRIQTFIERLCVKSDFFCEPLEIVLVECTLVFTCLAFIQDVVICPELILVCRAFGSFRRPR